MAAYYNEKTAGKVLKNIIKDVSKSGRKALAGTWIDESGRQCVCDGYRAARLNTPLAGFEEVQGVDLNNIYTAPAEYWIPVELPTAPELRAMIAAEKKTPSPRGKLYTFGTVQQDGGETILPAVNMKYLLDLVELFPGARCHYTARTRNIKTGEIVATSYAPYHFETEDGDGLLLPVRTMDDEGNVPAWAKVRRPAPETVPAAPSLPVYGVRAFLALAAREAS